MPDNIRPDKGTQTDVENPWLIVGHNADGRLIAGAYPDEGTAVKRARAAAAEKGVPVYVAVVTRVCARLPGEADEHLGE